MMRRKIARTVGANEYDLIIIGGGPAGMAAAAAAKENGIDKVLVLERNAYLGGVLPQCIHDGFGVFEFGESLTGSEYAVRWRHIIENKQIEYYVNASVIGISYCENDICGKDYAARNNSVLAECNSYGISSFFRVRVSSPELGIAVLKTKSIIPAMGCRERTIGQLQIPGGRPSGIMTAGAAQYMMNIQNFLPGRTVVILGSGDVGLIVARRLTLEGANVKMILGERASGLARNYENCVKDMSIPVRFGWTVTQIHGFKRLTGVTVQQADSNGNTTDKRSEYIRCDTLIVAAGLIPEREVWSDFSVPGVFPCGNVVQIYDTADEVTVSGRRAGRAAAHWLKEEESDEDDNDGYHFEDFHAGRKLTEEDMRILERTAVVERAPDVRSEDGSEESSREYLYCTLCPIGCRMSISFINMTHDISGNGCENGMKFACRELSDPRRILTTTVKMLCGEKQMLVPVKSDRPVPVNMMRTIVKTCSRYKKKCDVSIRCGDILISNVCGSGADIIATGEIIF